jgi:hypothetical protein
LTRSQANEWTEIVAALPANWFPRETYPLLMSLCQQISRLRDLSELIEVLGPRRNTAHYIELIREERETIKTIITLSTKMRLTQGSSFSKYHTRQKFGTRDVTLRGKVETPWTDDNVTNVTFGVAKKR